MKTISDKRIKEYEAYLINEEKSQATIEKYISTRVVDGEKPSKRQLKNRKLFIPLTFCILKADIRYIA